MGFWDLFFGRTNAELQEVLNAGAVVVDVRSVNEYKQGHVKGSLNIPIDQLSHKISRLKKYKQPLVLCCASGMRSATGVATLRNAGFSNVYNGRTWIKVNRLKNQ